MSMPHIDWATFDYCNENRKGSFEDMTRRLFGLHFLKNTQLLHSDHNTPGIEVLPVLEPPRDNGLPQRLVSFQSKHFDQGAVDYTKIQESAKMAVKHFKGKLDLIYLFCNKTITTTSKGFEAAQTILSAAGIELQPVSNTELLDLICQYPDIYNYFFQPRTKGATNWSTGGTPQITIDSVTGAITILPPTHQSEAINSKLLKELISQKVADCHKYAASLELDALRAEIDNLFAHDIENINEASALYFYKFILSLRANEDSDEVLSNCGDYKHEAEWLKNFYALPTELSVEEFAKHDSVTQVFILDKLFTTQHWTNVVFLCNSLENSANADILMQVRLHHGLALFNLQQFEQASIILHKICEETHEPRMQMYALLSDIRSECAVYHRGESGDADSLAALLSQLQNHKGSYYYQAQELLVALVTLEASYLLGLSEKHYLEHAINEYNQLSQSVKDNAYVKFSHAHCLEINGSRDLATEIYRSLPWKSDAAVAERYMICLVLNGTPEQAIKIYCELENVAKTIQTQTTYLLALSRNESVSYLDELRSAISNYTDCLSALSQIAYYVESKAVADEIMTPTLKNSLSPSALSEIAFQNKMELLIYFSKYREIALLEKVLDSIESLDLINSFAVTQIYQALFEIVQQDPLRIASIHSEDSPISLIEHIADRFLQENVSKKYFLQIRILCASAKKAHFSMLRYSKELFEITHDLQTARNIVALLFERKDNRPESYLPYLSVLESSDVPAHCMAVSSAKLILGLDEEAERYAYKALYLLNGRDDFDVFKSFLGFCSYKLHRLREEDTMYSVKRNSVVLLEEYNAADEGNKIMICLDSESQFADASNRSMDVEHLTSSSPDYIRLIGSGLNQVLNFRGKKYKITQIMSRQQYALGYIFRKISKYPEEFEGAIHTISTENPEEMIDRIKALTDTSKRTKELIDTYHFGNSQFGLPIELVASGDYDRYIGVLRYLLYQPNEALYAGMYKYEDESGQRYVPTLSTLTLLSILGQLEILTPCQPDMIIPESYHLFFREKFAKAAELTKSGASTLFFVDGKPVMQESDKSIPDIWGAIIEFCNGCETKEVCDEERIAFRLFNEMSGEELLAGFKLDVIQLDALILAKRENATYLCDDLFFRRVAEGLRIRNLNFVSLLQHYNDIDYIVPILMEMSKTNYIYLPLWARDSGEQNVLITNLLNGERKQMYYGSMLKAYFDEFEKMARELFGDDIVDQAKEKAKVKLIEQSSKLEK